MICITLLGYSAHDCNRFTHPCIPLGCGNFLSHGFLPFLFLHNMRCIPQRDCPTHPRLHVSSYGSGLVWFDESKLIGQPCGAICNRYCLLDRRGSLRCFPANGFVRLLHQSIKIRTNVTNDCVCNEAVWASTTFCN